ncbi:FUSC family protein [Nocardioides ochotonae]|uniref:FUSC family protein n=1 Tax=Nocardioides ochotonae TaxID=2685869 RepID=UPI0014084FF7|nr:FUSC family protein [Nocardioides ochotonae]
MDNLWLLLGIVVLTAALLDVVLTALDFDEAGFISGRLSRGVWLVVRLFTRRMSRRWRRAVLRQVTWVHMVVIIIAWLLGIIVGFGLIYYGQMSRSTFSVSGTDAGLTLFDALYFSAAQLSTVGGSALTAETDLLRFLSIAETLSGVLLLSLILTFLLGVFSVISDLSALCRYFFTAERGAGSPVASLAAFFREGEPSGLDGHLDGIAGSFSSYVDGLRFHHSAYYFQSGQDQFALPYAVRMLAGTLSALRWGLPTGHPAATEPGLVPLTFQFLEFEDYLERMATWRNVTVPEVVSREEFERIVGHPERDTQDLWVTRFVELNAAMGQLARIDPLADLDDAYQRYRQWLPFEFRAQRMTLAVSDDLDYQPVIVSDRPVSMLQAEDSVALDSVQTGTVPDIDPRLLSVRASREPPTRRQLFAARFLSLTDPGNARLRAATRAMLAAVASAGALYAVFDELDRTSVEPAVFGGFVAMLSSGAAVGQTQRDRRITSLVVAVPISALVLLGALVSDSVWLTGVLVVAVATLAVAARRFGPRWSTLGQVSFMGYYFALILRLEPSDVLAYVAAAVVGVGAAFVFNHVLIPERPPVVLRQGLEGYARRMVSSMDALLDAVSWARWDRAVRAHVEVELQQLRAHATFVGGQLRQGEATAGMPAGRAVALRLRLFDSELALMSLVASARGLAGVTVSLEARARLAGRVELLQAHLAELTVASLPGSDGGRRAPSGLAPWVDADPPAAWPRAARLVFESVDELHRSAVRLRDAAIAAMDPPVAEVAATAQAEEEREEERQEVADTTTIPAAGDTGVAAAPDAGRGSGLLAPAVRRAVQAGVASAASLLAGWLVSTTHQYWATLSAFQVLGDTDGDTFVKGARRVAGTVVGAAVGFGIALSEAAIAPVIMPLLALAVFASVYYRQVSPAVATFWTTMIFALLYEYLGNLTTLALAQRVAETLLGAVIALVVAYVVLPTRTRTVLDENVSVLARDIDAIVTASMGRLAGAPPTALPQLRQRVLTASQDVRTVVATAEPLRHAPGALGPEGIEGRLTAVWALTSHARRLVRAAERAIVTGVGPHDQDWRGMARSTSTNIAALTTALDGRLPGPLVLEVASFEMSGSGPTDRLMDDVMRELTRINQTVLALLELVSPGALEGVAPAHDSTVA